MCFMIFKILKSNYEAMSDNYNISLSFTYGRSVAFFANKTDHQEITDSVNNHKTNTSHFCKNIVFTLFFLVFLRFILYNLTLSLI